MDRTQVLGITAEPRVDVAQRGTPRNATGQLAINRAASQTRRGPPMAFSRVCKPWGFRESWNYGVCKPGYSNVRSGHVWDKQTSLGMYGAGLTFSAT